jgi:hypothetical protein
MPWWLMLLQNLQGVCLTSRCKEPAGAVLCCVMSHGAHCRVPCKCWSASHVQLQTGPAPWCEQDPIRLKDLEWCGAGQTPRPGSSDDAKPEATAVHLPPDSGTAAAGISDEQLSRWLAGNPVLPLHPPRLPYIAVAPAVLVHIPPFLFLVSD